VIRRLRKTGVKVRLLVCGGSARISPDAAVVGVGRVDDMPAHYAAADIAAQPTFYDACSLTTLESLASGLPMITTRLNGASELVTPGVDGFVIDGPHDEAALADRLALLAADPWRRAVMGRAARRLAEAHGCDDCFARIVAVYGEVVASRGGALRWRDAVETGRRRIAA
jgi:UDP-glucose:(heptosyl)LPS alpha-1,3-glucosyltransferase